VAYQLLLDRGYTGHEHLDSVGLIHMNGRLYDPMTRRFLAPDNYVQDPYNTLPIAIGINRYGYVYNNPLSYNDPSGEFIVETILIATGIFAIGNTVAQAINGNINSFGDAFRAFFQGGITGAALGVGIAASISVPVLGPIVKWSGYLYAGATGISVVSGLGHGIFTGDWSGLENAGKLFLGNFYLDENRSFFGGILQGVSRFSWELPQTTIGGSYSQIRNTFGNIDEVRYFGGATFAINENTNSRWGVSLGNFININLRGSLNEENHPDGWMFSEEGLFLHEYGHTFQSQRFGLSYLFAIGIPSALSANSENHDRKWYELQANRWAWKYANQHGFLDYWPFNRYLFN